MSIKAGHKIVPVIGEECQKQYDEFTGNRVGTMRLIPDNWFLTTPYLQFADKYYEFKYKPTDVVVMTFIKSGTTWTQEILWTLLENPNLDHPDAHLSVNVRSPFLDFDFVLKSLPNTILKPGGEVYEMFVKNFPERDPEDGIFWQIAELSKDPRLIKTHLPFSLITPKLLDTCKVVYIARDPKDVAVSYYHHSKLIKGHGFVGDIDRFIDHFINDTLLYSPYWTHVEEAWKNRSHPNLHFCFYEDRKADPKGEVTRLCNFLGLERTEKQIEDIVEYTKFSAMKARDNLIEGMDVDGVMDKKYLKKEGGFFRKGESGDWKNIMTAEQAKRIDDWTNKNVARFDGHYKYKTN